MTEIDIRHMSEHYRNIRKAVYEKATCPLQYNSDIHLKNKELLKNQVEKLCNDSNLKNYFGFDKNTATAIWHKLWTTNRYAYITAQIATTEIKHIENIFDNYETFIKNDWDITAKGTKLISGGSQIHHFKNKTGDFSGKQTIGNIPKLVKIVSVARNLTDFMKKKNTTTPVLDFITNGYECENVWAIHEHLKTIGYKGDLTALHLMMDLGFQVIKPDIVISKLFLDWGWLHKIIPGLPNDVDFYDLKGKGKYKTRFKYTDKKMYKPIINLAQKIVSITKREDLEKDIGWVSGNPIREFDIFIVKYGQRPEREFGIVQTLYCL